MSKITDETVKIHIPLRLHNAIIKASNDDCANMTDYFLNMIISANKDFRVEQDIFNKMVYYIIDL